MYQFLKLIRGQSKTVHLLENIIDSSHIPHALIFTGPRNVGQHYAAKQFLKSLLIKSESSRVLEPKIDRLEDPYIKYVIPLPRGKGETADDMPFSKIPQSEIENITSEIGEKKDNPYYEIQIENANNIKINSIRDIKKNLSINYSDIDHRMIIIEDAHLMTKEAQNALLKSLEEPPEGIIFILITHKPELLLTTINSRCWEINFTWLPDEIVEEILITKFNIENTLSKQVAPFSEGSIHYAIQLLNYGFDEIIELTINILRFSLARWYNTAIKLMQKEISTTSKDVIPILVSLMISWFNDVQKYKSGIGKLHFSNYVDTLEKFNTKYSDIEISKILFDLNNLKDKLDLNINLNIIVLNIIFRIASIGTR